MSYSPPDEDTILADLLAAYRATVPGADISADSEIYARARLAAAAAAMVCHGVRTVEDQVFPQTADEDNLERHAGLYGLARKAPTAATGGQVRVTGTPSTPVSSALTLFHDDGTQFVTTSTGTIGGGGSLDLDAEAVTEGSAGNRIVDDELTIQSPPTGVDSTATVIADFSGGTDIESVDALVARVLTRMRAGNAGGTHLDYEQWALAVDGVLSADCLPTRLGPGTVSVAVFTEAASGYRTPAGSTLRAAVLAELDDQRPVTAEVDVPTVTEVAVDVTITDLEVEPGFDGAEVATAIEDAVEAFIFGLTTGDTLYLTQLGRTIAGVAGVRDYSLDAPASNKAATVDDTTVEILTPGTISVGLA